MTRSCLEYKILNQYRSLWIVDEIFRTQQSEASTF